MSYTFFLHTFELKNFASLYQFDNTIIQFQQRFLNFAEDSALIGNKERLI